MVQHSSNFTQLTDFDPILTEIYYQHFDVAVVGRSGQIGIEANRINAAGVLEIFNQQLSTKGKETDLRIGSFKDPKVFTGKVEYQTVQRGYEVEYVPDEYVSGFQVERKLMDDMQYGSIFAQAEEMGTAFGRRIRKDATSVFNNAFDTAVTGYDGKALCANDHLRSRTDDTAIDNYLALGLTSDNLETAITTMQDFGDDNGEEIIIMPDTLIVPRALRRTALQIAGSERDPENANNAMNVHMGMNVIVDPYLSDSNAWFVVDSAMARRYLKWYNRILPEFGAESDFDTFIRKYRGYMRYSFGWSDFRWIIGCNPS